jgi:hypothetical protein
MMPHGWSERPRGMLLVTLMERFKWNKGVKLNGTGVVQNCALKRAASTVTNDCVADHLVARAYWLLGREEHRTVGGKVSTNRRSTVVTISVPAQGMPVATSIPCTPSSPPCSVSNTTFGSALLAPALIEVEAPSSPPPTTTPTSPPAAAAAVLVENPR